jgi:hypothetical protein
MRGSISRDGRWERRRPRAAESAAMVARACGAAACPQQQRAGGGARPAVAAMVGSRRVRVGIGVENPTARNLCTNLQHRKLRKKKPTEAI